MGLGRTGDTIVIGELARVRAQHRLKRWAAAAVLAAIGLGAHRSAAQNAPYTPAPLPTGYPGQVSGDQPNATPAGDTTTSPAGDPPSRVVRVSLLNGAVSAEPASVNSFSPAELNQVLTTGDRIYTDPAAEAELQAGGMAVRLGGGTDLTVSAMTDTLAQFGLAAGSVHLRSLTIVPGTVLELDSPDAALTVLQPGDVRVDVDPAAHTTTVLLNSGQVQVDGPGLSQILAPGQRIRIHGGDPAGGEAPFAEPLAPGDSDGLDGFSDGRDNLYASGADADSPYVSPDTVGGADLAAYGSWDASDFGPVWFPVVAVGWQPYSFGHWRWVAPWGWTWVGSEPWAFAPFHYGRWALLGGRWGWIPGSPAVRPVYAPALVAFAGGPQFSASLGYAPGLGITAWFPLGPHEAYVPPYHGSTLYVNRVNASNLFNPNAAEVQGLYNQRAVNVFTSGAPASRSFADRTAGTVAVAQSSFAAGRSVNDAVLHLSAEALAAAPVLPHPPVAPDRSMLVPGEAVALPPVLARPVLADGAAAAGSQTRGTGAVRFHIADPPAAAPGFDRQRQATEMSDPGHALSPGQVQTLRGSRSGGAPAAREGAAGANPAHTGTAPAARSDTAPTTSHR